jgi:hypothetical protein
VSCGEAGELTASFTEVRGDTNGDGPRPWLAGRAKLRPDELTPDEVGSASDWV